MRISTTLLLALSLTLAVGCKKKKDGDPVDKTPTEGSGSAGATAGSGSAPAPAEKPLVGADLAKRYLECGAHVNTGDWDKFGGCIDDGFKGHEAAMNMDMSKTDVVAMMGDMKKAFPDMTFQPQVVLVNGRSIAAVALTTGTHSGDMKTPMGEMKATNKKTGMLMFHRIKFNDANKGTEEWVMSDHGTMMAQLGKGSKDNPGRPVMDKGMDGAPMIVVAANDDKEKANLAAFTKANDAFNAHKSADLVAMMTADAVESDQAEAKDAVGTKAIQKNADMYMKAFPDVKTETSEVWAAGDYVVAIGTATGTNTGDLGPIKKTGKVVTIAFAEIAQFKDGKVAKLWRFRDSVQFATQLGLIKMPDAGAGSAAGSGSAAPADKTK